MSDLNIQALVNDHVTVEAGVATVAQEGIDAALEAAAIDTKEYKRMQKAASVVAAGIIDAVGEKSINSMKEDKNLQAVASNFKIGHEEYVVGVNREGTVRVPGKAGEPTVNKQVEGYTTVRRKTKIGNNVIGESRKRIAALGKATLGA